MDFLSYFQLSLVEIYFVIFTVFIASIIRGFNGFGFSATCISGFSFILPAIEIVPIILMLEVLISIFMAPYVWSKIDWNLVLKVLIGIAIGSPFGLYLLKYLSPETTHFYVCLIRLYLFCMRLCVCNVLYLFLIRFMCFTNPLWPMCPPAGFCFPAKQASPDLLRCPNIFVEAFLCIVGIFLFEFMVTYLIYQLGRPKADY